MPRRRRTLEEQESYNVQRRMRNSESQRRRRQVAHNRLIDERRQEDYLGEMDVLCCHCNAKHFVSEKVANKKLSFNDCCSHGVVALDPKPIFPEELSGMFNGTYHKSNDFFENIRYYNNSLSFASFNANLYNFQSRRQGPYCFKIQGRIYYQINTALYPSENESPLFGQLFFVDPEEALHFRMNQSTRFDRETISILDSVIREHNVFAQSYEMMKKEFETQRLLLGQSENEPELQLLFMLKPGTDRRRYSFQRTNEVAAILATTADGEIPESYVTIRNKTTKTLECVYNGPKCRAMDLSSFLPIWSQRIA